MKKTIVVVMAIAMLCCVASTSNAVETVYDWSVCECGADIYRGDANEDGVVDASDAVFISNYLFMSGTEPCLVNADVDDDGDVLITDVYLIMEWLNMGGPGPEAPYPNSFVYPCHCEMDDNSAPFGPCAGWLLVGDTNMDDEITLADAVYIVEFLEGNIDPEDVVCFTVLDVNMDMRVTVADATRIADYLVHQVALPAWWTTVCHDW